MKKSKKSLTATLVFNTGVNMLMPAKDKRDWIRNRQEKLLAQSHCDGLPDKIILKGFFADADNRYIETSQTDLIVPVQFYLLPAPLMRDPLIRPALIYLLDGEPEFIYPHPESIQAGVIKYLKAREIPHTLSTAAFNQTEELAEVMATRLMVSQVNKEWGATPKDLAQRYGRTLSTMRRHLIHARHDKVISCTDELNVEDVALFDTWMAENIQMRSPKKKRK